MLLSRSWCVASAVAWLACSAPPREAPTPTTITVPAVADAGITTASPVGPPPPAPRALFASGASHTCVLDRGVAYCWGFNGYGQLGVGSRADAHVPARLPFDDIETLDVGGVSTCVVRKSGELTCAGEHEMFGVDEHATERGFFARVPGFERVKRVAVSVSAICAEEDDGAVRCAGSEADVVPRPGASRAQPIDGVLRPTALRLEPYYGCAIADGEVRCWGEAWMGLIPGKAPPIGFAATRAPAIVPRLRGAVQIAMGDHHACARMRDGTVSCWGSNGRSKLGRVTRESYDFEPAPATGVTDAVDIAAGAYHTCIVDRRGGVRCWGDDGTGAGEAIHDVLMPDEERAVSIRAGLMHTCAMLASGDVACWGSNSLSQCGMDPDENSARVAWRIKLPPR